MVRPYTRHPVASTQQRAEIDSMFGVRAARRSGGSSIGGDEAGAADGFLGGCGSGAPTSRPGCVSRVSGSTPPAESKKIHAKDSRTSRAVGCPSRMPLLRPTTFDHLRMPAALARGSRTRLAPVPDRAPAQDDRALVPVLARPEPQIPPVPTTLVDYLDDRADPTFWG